MKEFQQKLFLAIVIILFFLLGHTNTSEASSNKHVFNVDIKYIVQGHNKNLYQVTCDNGKQHTIIFNPEEQDYLYFSPNKENYIKYSDIKFNDLIYFGRWVCKNK